MHLPTSRMTLLGLLASSLSLAACDVPSVDENNLAPAAVSSADPEQTSANASEPEQTNDSTAPQATQDVPLLEGQELPPHQEVEDEEVALEEQLRCQIQGEWLQGMVDHSGSAVLATPLTLLAEDVPGEEEFDDSSGALFINGEMASPCHYDYPNASAKITGKLGAEAIWGGRRDGQSICFMVGESYGMAIYVGTFAADCSIAGSVSNHGGSYDWEALPADQSDD